MASRDRWTSTDVLAAALIAAAVTCPGPPAVVYPGPMRVYRSRVVACAGNRSFVVREALLRRPSSSLRSGRELTSAWAAGRWIAWAEVRYANGRSTGIVGVNRGRRTVYRRVVLRAGPRYQEVSVVITTRGELAWAAEGRLGMTRVGARRARTIARDVSPPLRLEDDRTVRWWADYDALAYADLRPWPGRGCASRTRFRVIAESERLRVTMAQYRIGEYDSASAVRACVRETGADPVIATGRASFRVAGLVADWVVLTRRVSGRGACGWLRVEVNAVPSGLAGRPGTMSACDEREPDARQPLTVTASGAPAWIVNSTDRSALLTTVGRDVIELDEARPGGLTGLTADGTVVRWLHDGEPRSMDLG